MKIRNVVHKGLRRFIENDDAAGLRRFIENDDAAGLPAAAHAKVHKIVSFLQDMEHESELRSVPVWNAHQMTGDRKGAWSLMVSKNWRITFQIDREEIEIVDLNYEDYH